MKKKINEQISCKFLYVFNIICDFSLKKIKNGINDNEMPTILERIRLNVCFVLLKLSVRLKSVDNK
jgi:hypothetical protein